MIATIQSNVENQDETSCDTLYSLIDQLVSGGDDRVEIVRNGRNAYGTPPQPDADDIWLSSSTASAITPRGYAAVNAISGTLGQGGQWLDTGITALCVSVRSRLNALFGIEGSAAILAASGMDAELLMLGIAERCGDRPLTTIIIAPKELGSGVTLACTGHHFRKRPCLGGDVTQGERLAGWEDTDLMVEAVDLRLPDGVVRDRDSVDAEIAAHTNEALAAGRNVLLHVLDTDPTGLQTCTRETASRLMRSAPGRVHTVVDSCQLRCAPDQIRADLDRGFAVIVTGSQFAGGPPLSGALLLPPALAEQFAAAPTLPQGFRDYTAAHDWPSSLRPTVLDDPRRHNLGAALRWVAALTEYEALQALDAETSAAIIAQFDAEICRRVDDIRLVRPLFSATDDTRRTHSIVSLVPLGTNCAPLSMAQAQDLHRALCTRIDTPESAAMRRIVNIGQPVAIGERAALRVCIEAPRIVDIAEQMANGRTMAEAFAKTEADLDALFAKWVALIDGKVWGRDRRRNGSPSSRKI